MERGKEKKGVVFWDPPDICVSSNVELPLVYFLSMQTNPKIGLLQCSASGNDNSTCIKQLPLSQFYLLLLYFSINPLFIQTNACHRMAIYAKYSTIIMWWYSAETTAKSKHNSNNTSKTQIR